MSDAPKKEKPDKYFKITTRKYEGCKDYSEYFVKAKTPTAAVRAACVGDDEFLTIEQTLLFEGYDHELD